MTKKSQCKKLMTEFFGPNSARLVDNMSEENCVEQCKTKVMAYLGKDKAKIFDEIART